MVGSRPALLPVAGLGLGIVGQTATGDIPEAWPAAALAAALAGLAAFLIHHPLRQLTWLAVGWTLAGWVAATLERAPLSPADLRHQLADSAHLVELRGEVETTPVLRLNDLPGPDGTIDARSHLELKVRAWREPGGLWQVGDGRAWVSTRGGPVTGLGRGRHVQVGGVLTRPEGPVADGVLDYRRFLEDRGIHWTLRVAGPADWILETQPGWRPPWSERFIPWAQRALSRGLPDDAHTRLLWAMALGWRTALSGGLDETFQAAGTLHVFAISGLHLALLTANLVAVLRALRLPRRACGLLVLPALWFYVAATGWQSSAIRAAVMTSVLIGTWLWERPADSLNSLAVAGAGLLALQPGQLFQVGFQLSFGIVAGLVVGVPLLQGFGRRLWPGMPDPYLPADLQSRWQRWLADPLRALGLLLSTSVTATLVSLPLTAEHFHRVSTIGVLANLLVVPLSTVSLAGCLASLMTTPWAEPLAEIFNAGAWLAMAGMVGVSEWAGRLPGSAWWVPSPGLVGWIGWLSLILAAGIGSAMNRGGRWALAVLGIALLVGRVGWHLSGGGAHRITILPGGEAIVLDGPGRTADAVVHTGGKRRGPQVLEPFLRAQGWNHAPQLWALQADAAHLGGATQFVAQLRPRFLVTGDPRQRSPAFRRLLSWARDAGVPVRTVWRGDTLGGWQVVSPARSDGGRTADDNSVAVLGDPGEVRVLLLSDLGPSAQLRLADRGRADGGLPADIVVAGIPRSGEPLRDELLAVVRPQLIVVASATMPAGGAPTTATRRRLARHGVPVVYIGDRGTVTLSLRAGRAEVRSQDGSRWRLEARDGESREPSVRRGGPR